MFRAYFKASTNLVHSRKRVLLPGAFLALAMPALAVTATFAPPSHHGAQAHPVLAIGEPAMAAPPGASPSPEATGLPQAAPGGVTVHLPGLTFSSQAGVAPAARPGTRIVVPSVGLQVSVVDYGDCSGDTPMTRLSAVHFTCTPSAVTTFVGHNPGVFTPLLRTQQGDRVYYQHDGVQDAWVLTARYRVSPQEAATYAEDGSYAHAVFATCAEPDSSAYWIFTAAPLGTGARAAAANPAPAPSSRPGSAHPGPAPSPSPSPTPGGLPGGLTLPPPPPPPI